MSNNNDYDISDSKDCETYINQFIQEFTIRSAEIGKGQSLNVPCRVVKNVWWGHGVFWIMQGQ
jgi:hypothetical protein